MGNIDFSQLWDSFAATLRMFKVQDFLDIVIVAVIIYYLIRLLRETRAGQLVKGVFGILVMYAVAYFVGFRTVKTIMEYIIRSGAIVMLVLFQPELRKILDQVGRTSLSSLPVFSGSQEQGRAMTIRTISAICDSCAMMSKERTGALIVMEKSTRIGDIISTGTIIDAQASTELIKNVFYPKTPLHDGALVIRGNRLYAAGCFLPLSDNYEISRTLGTRHRAALGMSEVSDAVVVVVSEETGNISVAKNGKLNLRLTANNLSKILYDEFVEQGELDGARKKIFGKKGTKQP